MILVDNRNVSVCVVVLCVELRLCKSYVFMVDHLVFAYLNEFQGGANFFALNIGCGLVLNAADVKEAIRLARKICPERWVKDGQRSNETQEIALRDLLRLLTKAGWPGVMRYGLLKWPLDGKTPPLKFVYNSKRFTLLLGELQTEIGVLSDCVRLSCSVEYLIPILCSGYPLTTCVIPSFSEGFLPVLFKFVADDDQLQFPRAKVESKWKQQFMHLKAAIVREVRHEIDPKKRGRRSKKSG